jgi:hypothetical protein
VNISREEAQASLTAIQQTRTQTLKAQGFSGYYLILWGLILFAGFLANQFLNSSMLPWIWGGLITVVWVISTFLGIHQGKQARSLIGGRIALFYGVLLGFTLLWLIILQPLNLKQSYLFVVTIYMFGGNVAGVFARSVSTIVGCMSLTVLAVAGYYLLPAYFFLWVAITCGLAMVGIGLFLRLRWR